MLGPRQSAELEDAILARLDDACRRKGGEDGDDDDHDRLRLTDPILGLPITRGGLDWVRSLSVPSSTSPKRRGGGYGDDDVDEYDDDDDDDADSIVVEIRPPTMLHPRLGELASGVAGVVREGAASWIEERRRRAPPASPGSGSDFWSDPVLGEVLPDRIGVAIRVSSAGPPPPSSSSVGDADRPPSSASSDHRAGGGGALQDVSHVLAVYSCKGGVGKSTVAVNLAYRLSAMGGRVGLADLDVYGPSLPLLVRPDDPAVRRSPPGAGLGPNAVEPITHRGVRLMSLGYVSPDSGAPGSGPGGGAAVMRGPMAGRVVRQLLHGTNWGDLDVLVLDMPPGTGDVQLEACQSLSLSGAVAVSTPSSLAWADVEKGVAMFGDMGVPTLAVVENMAYFVCEGGGRHYPFGRPSDDRASSSSSSSRYLPGPSRFFHLPVSPAVRDSNESGSPLCCDGWGGAAEPPRVLHADGGAAADAFSRLADAISEDLLLLRHGAGPPLIASRGGGDAAVAGAATATTTTSVVTIDEAGDSVSFDVPFTRLSADNESGKLVVRLFYDGGGYQRIISGIELRKRDPRTGEEEDGPAAVAPMMRGGGRCGGGGDASSMVRHHAAHVGPDAAAKDGLFPARVTRKGNYGYEVEWADGAKVIYSLLAIAKAAGGKSLGSSSRDEE